MDIPHHELLALARAFVAQATPIIREQERLIDHLEESRPLNPFIGRLFGTVATASDAIAEQEVLIERLSQSGDSK